MSTPIFDSAPHPPEVAMTIENDTDRDVAAFSTISSFVHSHSEELSLPAELRVQAKLSQQIYPSSASSSMAYAPSLSTTASRSSSRRSSLSSSSSSSSPSSPSRTRGRTRVRTTVQSMTLHKFARSLSRSEARSNSRAQSPTHGDVAASKNGLSHHSHKIKLTLPASPLLSTRHRSHSVVTLSSEEQELIRIAAEKAELKKLKLANMKNLENVLHTGIDALPVRSTKSLTQPQEMKFRTEGRAKVRTIHTNSDEAQIEKEKIAQRQRALLQLARANGVTSSAPFSFQTSIRSRSVTPSRQSLSPQRSASFTRTTPRSHSRPASRSVSRTSSPIRSMPSTPRSASVSASRRSTLETPASLKKERPSSTSHASSLTQPKPFALRTDARCPSNSSHSDPFVSLAEQLTHWLGSGSDRVVHQSAHNQGVTQPKEFLLHTSSRVKHEKILSSEERILAEIEAAKSKDRSTSLSTPRPHSTESTRSTSSAPSVTHCQPFHLSCGDLTPKVKVDKDEIERVAVEKEREERKRKLLALAKQNGITVAQAPNLAVLQRVPVKEPEKIDPSSDPIGSLPTLLSLPLPLTTPAPFRLSTEVRGAHKEDSFRSKLAEETHHAKLAASFKAKPMPAHESAPTFIPQLPHRKILADLTPNLKSLELHEASERNWKSQLDAERDADKKQRQFIAKPVPSSLKVPSVIPSPVALPLTRPIELHFSSDDRAIKRAEFDAIKADHAAAAQAERKRLQDDQIKQDEVELKQYRQTLVHHPQPIPKAVIKPSKAFKPPR